MAFGIPSVSSQKFEFDLNRNLIIGYAVLSVEQLGWGIFGGSEDTLGVEINLDEADNLYLLEVVAEPQKLFVKSSVAQGADDEPEIATKSVEQFLEKFRELESSIPKEKALERFNQFQEELRASEEEPKESLKENIFGFFSLFIPTEGYFIAPILVLINIVVFIVMVINGVSIMAPSSEAIISWGGNFAPLTQSGEWWRLITCNFLHIGILHLAFNTWALTYAGALLEPMIGKVKFLLAYLLTGLSSAVLSLFFHSNNVSAGASGAIFGLFGVLLALLLTNFIDKRIRKSILSSTAIFIGANLLYGMKDGIDNAGHVGGLVGGFIIGFSFYPLLIKKREKSAESAMLSTISVVFIGLCFVAFKAVPQSEDLRYNELNREFMVLETEALEVFDMFETKPKYYIVDHLKNKGVKNWERGIEIAKEAQTLNIDSKLIEYSKGLEKYCVLRKETYQLIIKAVEEETDIYDNDIEVYNTKIDSIVDALQ